VAVVECVPRAETVFVEPLTADDWEVTEMHAQYLETQLLRQICIVFVNHVIPVWIHKSVLVRMKVVVIRLAGATSMVNGVGCAFMSSATELVVAPKALKPTAQSGTKAYALADGIQLKVLPLRFRGQDTSFGARLSLLEPEELRDVEDIPVDDERTCFVHPCVLEALVDMHRATTGEAVTDSSSSQPVGALTAVLSTKCVVGSDSAAKGLVESLVVKLMPSRYVYGPRVRPLLAVHH
jgi:hypothetical protein